MTRLPSSLLTLVGVGLTSPRQALVHTTTVHPKSKTFPGSGELGQRKVSGNKQLGILGLNQHIVPVDTLNNLRSGVKLGLDDLVLILLSLVNLVFRIRNCMNYSLSPRQGFKPLVSRLLTHEPTTVRDKGGTTRDGVRSPTGSVSRRFCVRTPVQSEPVRETLSTTVTGCTGSPKDRPHYP